MNVRTCVCVVGALLLAGLFGHGTSVGADPRRPEPSNNHASLGASTVGLLSSPFGQGPVLAVAALYSQPTGSERRKDEVKRPGDDKGSTSKATIELLHSLTKLALKVEDRVGKLEAQLREMQDREKKAEAKTKAEQEATLKYMRGVAEGFVDCGIRQDATGLATSMTAEFKKSTGGDFDAWWIRHFPPSNYREYKIDDAMLAPSGLEATFQGTLSDKDKKRGRFMLRVARDKDSGRYLVVFFSVRHE